MIKYKFELRNLEHHKYMDKAPNGLLEVSVIDNGIGIKADQHHKLFKLFGYLENSEKLNTKGIGLGLHISKMISSQFGGDICF